MTTHMQPVASLASLVMAVMATGTALGQPAGRPDDTTTLASQAILYELRASDEGRRTEFEMLLAQHLHTTGRTPEDIVDTIEGLRRSTHGAARPPGDQPQSMFEFEVGIGLAVPLVPFASVDASVSYQTEAPDFSELVPPLQVQPPAQMRNRRGEPLLTTDDLMDHLAARYNALGTEGDWLSAHQRLEFQSVRVAEHARMWRTDLDYRELSNRLFDGRLARPTDDPETIMDANPRFADHTRLKEIVELHERASGDGDEANLAATALARHALTASAELVDATTDEEVEAQQGGGGEDDGPAREVDATTDEEVEAQQRRARSANIRNLYAGARLSATFLTYVDPELGRQLHAVHDTAVGISEAITTFRTAVADGANQLGASLVAGGSIASVTLAFGRALMGIKSPHQQVMEQLAKIREEIANLRTEMHQRMDGLHDALDDVYMALSRGQGAIRADLNRAMTLLHRQAEQLQRIDQRMSDLEWLTIVGNEETRLALQTDILTAAGCIRPDKLHDDELNADDYEICVNLFGSNIGDPDSNSPRDRGLLRRQLTEATEHLANRDLERSATLALRRFVRALESAGKPATGLPQEVVGYRTLLYAREEVTQFLYDNEEQTRRAIERGGFQDMGMFRGLERYGDDLAEYVEAIQQDVAAFQADEPSAIGALLESMRAIIRTLKGHFRTATDKFHDNSISADAAVWIKGRAAPTWMHVVEDGNCYDDTISTTTKHEVARIVSRAIHPRDLRPARSGHGRIEVCVRTQNRIEEGPARYGAWTNLTVLADYSPNAVCAEEPIQLIEWRATKRGHIPWRRSSDRNDMAIQGAEANAAKMGSPEEQLPERCRYRNIVNQWSDQETDELRETIRTATAAAVAAADKELAQEENYIHSYLRTAYELGPNLAPVRSKLADLLETAPPWHVLGAADAGVDAIADWLTSERMQSNARTNRLVVVELAEPQQRNDGGSGGGGGSEPQRSLKLISRFHAMLYAVVTILAVLVTASMRFLCIYTKRGPWHPGSGSGGKIF